MKLLIVFALLRGSLLIAAEDRVTDLITRAQNGDVAAQFDLGLMYSNGNGVPKDSSEAVKWFRKAAEHGNTSANSTSA